MSRLITAHWTCVDDFKLPLPLSPPPPPEDTAAAVKD